MGKNVSSEQIVISDCIIALGSNQEYDGIGPSELLEEAFDELVGRGFVIRNRSRFFQTPAFPAGAGPDFVNAAAVLETSIAPAEILAQLHSVEAKLGRQRVQRWGARTLDLDLIAVGGLVLPDAETYQYWCELPMEAQKTTTPQELILPHPRLADRAFVLVPLLDVAPDWCHPITGKSVQQMHDSLPVTLRDEVVAL
ncbi:2-amino-4-hydroxy-6-hydroxymethyldihydropteridine pyrophosphokinase [Sulfitobacter donghicola DSW-25 = KCTC 12864 = JCM 14565]|uniref:2-amino-4-hydroxy-6-hydroxymethyldihydropteridine pyrophosphokinase n=2 Tax=Sulfitobacter TaxID=60136 RepID=A0A073IMP3_9RHOB|nr:2-amino-4-hydroxy-6-hydroxymethyldihydropteridine pyrophosphokinase [Sulfitobacter donghicola DSW-25 = KCTC 12864 = JCM 14565]KIN68293.1 2-amino-4-hydroxy-6-hydroxymethyldihydropteridine pyrophosphokinase [Sulfitobacter donghicola DSW-25 = KCTC 12864 = JCM 14565]